MRYRIPTVGDTPREVEVFEIGIRVGMNLSAAQLSGAALKCAKTDPVKGALELAATQLGDLASGDWGNGEPVAAVVGSPSMWARFRTAIVDSEWPWLLLGAFCMLSAIAGAIRS